MFGFYTTAEVTHQPGTAPTEVALIVDLAASLPVHSEQEASMDGLRRSRIITMMRQASRRVTAAFVDKAAPEISETHHEIPRGIRNGLARTIQQDEQLASGLDEIGWPARPDHGSGAEHPGPVANAQGPVRGPDPDSGWSKSAWREGDPTPLAFDRKGIPTKSILDKYRGENDPQNRKRFFHPLTGQVGRAIFVMDGSGNYYSLNNPKIGRDYHSSILAGDDVAGACEHMIVRGEMREMGDESGHYRPSSEMNDRVLHVLRSQGMKTSYDFTQYDHLGKAR